MYKFGFIGCGNMGSALAKAICLAEGAENIMVCDLSESKAKDFAQSFGCKFGTVDEVANSSEYIFLAVKPQSLVDTLSGVKDLLKARLGDFVLVTMLAGTPTSRIEQVLGFKCPIIRIMPNVACQVGKGMTVCSKNERVSQEKMEEFKKAMRESGKLDEIAEENIDSYSVISGCGPAWACLMVEALADGAVACGVPRDKAYLYSAQMLEGSANLILESGKIPAQIKDSVCSPGGTTIEGVKALEENGFRNALVQAVKASYEKTKKM